MSDTHPGPASTPAPHSPSLSPHAPAELLSEDTRAVWSPRLSPDRCRIVYLENEALGPHQQCSRLRMVSSSRGHWGGVGVSVLDWGLGGGWWCPLPRLQWVLRLCKTHLVNVSRSTTGTPSTPPWCWRSCHGRHGVSTALGVVRGAQSSAEHPHSHYRLFPGHLLQCSARVVLGS